MVKLKFDTQPFFFDETTAQAPQAQAIFAADFLKRKTICRQNYSKALTEKWRAEICGLGILYNAHGHLLTNFDLQIRQSPSSSCHSAGIFLSTGNALQN
jgi:hypothetical protein